MAVAPFTQIFWGRPRLVVRFEVGVAEGTKFIRCLIWNAPATNWFERFVVVPVVDDLMAEYEILDSAGKAVFKSLKAKLKTQVGTFAGRVGVPASVAPTWFAFVAFDPRVGVHIVGSIGTKDNTQVPSLEGAYTAKITIYFGLRTKQVAYRFLASTTPPYLSGGEYPE